MFDLSSLSSAATRLEEGVSVPMLGPDGKETGAKLFIASYDSDRVRAAIRKQIAANEAIGGDDKQGDMEKLTMAMQVAAVADWSDVLLDGKPVKCSPDLVEQLMRFRWFRDQVVTVASDQAVFFGN